jgi:hypothetical protein
METIEKATTAIMKLGLLRTREGEAEAEVVAGAEGEAEAEVEAGLTDQNEVLRAVGVIETNQVGVVCAAIVK